MLENEVRQKVEEIVQNPQVGDVGEDERNTLRIIVAALFLGTDADRLAKFLRLNRDKFVRPRAKRLRESGIFIQGTLRQRGQVGVDAAVFEAKTDRKFFLWLTLAGLVAEGLAFRVEKPGSDPSFSRGSIVGGS